MQIFSSAANQIPILRTKKSRTRSVDVGQLDWDKYLMTNAKRSVIHNPS